MDNTVRDDTVRMKRKKGEKGETSPESELAVGDGAQHDAEPMSTAQLEEAKQYGREDLICHLADKIVDVAFLAVMAFVFARFVDNWLIESLRWTNLWGRLAAMYLIVTCLHFCISFPISVYGGHFLEHKFQMSNQTLAQWFWRYVKGVCLTLAFGLVLLEGLYLLITLTGFYWWLAAAGAFFLVSVVLGQLAPVLIMPLFHKIERFEDAALADRLANLAAGTGLTIEGVYRMKLSDETVKANAMLAGLGSTRRVIMGDTLLDGFNPDEIEVVFAHEIGHHVHRHIRSLLILGVLLSVSGFFVCHWLIGLWLGDGNWTSQPPVYAYPVLTLIITVFTMILAPAQNGLSRHFERQSDRYALRRTGNPNAYRSAFTKLAKLNKDDPDPHPWEIFWLHSHPPISQRLAMADQGSIH